MPYTDSDVAARDAMAEFFRARGIDCLPSAPDEKKPLCRFREYWDSPAPAELMARFPSPNLQCILGRSKGLIVVDLDGPEAVERWKSRRPKTWVVHSGAGGEHWWLRVPKSGAPLPKAVLWKGEGPHSAIERLGDRSLAMAPPSIHPKTGNRYKFLDVAHSPKRIAVPAMAPPWLLAMPDITPRPVVKMPERRPVTMVCVPDSAGRYRADDVRAAIPDVIALCQSWGLRFTGRERAGWAECHAIDRPDDRPSAAVHRESGVYKDLGSGAKLGLFDLASEVGGLGRDWKEAVAILGERFRARTAA